MNCWRLADVLVVVADRLSPGGLCLDDGIHHRESPKWLWLVAKTPYVICKPCGGGGGWWIFVVRVLCLCLLYIIHYS